MCVNCNVLYLCSETYRLVFTSLFLRSVVEQTHKHLSKNCNRISIIFQFLRLCCCRCFVIIIITVVVSHCQLSCDGFKERLKGTTERRREAAHIDQRNLCQFESNFPRLYSVERGIYGASSKSFLALFFSPRGIGLHGQKRTEKWYMEGSRLPVRVDWVILLKQMHKAVESWNHVSVKLCGNYDLLWGYMEIVFHEGSIGTSFKSATVRTLSVLVSSLEKAGGRAMLIIFAMTVSLRSN